MTDRRQTLAALDIPQSQGVPRTARTVAVTARRQAPSFGQPPNRPSAPSGRGRRIALFSPRLSVSALTSATLHAAILVALLLTARHALLVVPAPDKETQVELLMVEQKGAGNTTTPPTAAPSREAPPADQASASPPPPSTPGKDTIAAPPTPPPPDQAATDTLPTPPTPPDQPATAAQPAAAPAPPEPPTPPAQVASPARAAPPAPTPTPVLTFNLGGTDSESNALATGDGIIPASPDNTHRNRPPIYPDDAAMRGEQGAVTLLIHVSPYGLPAGIEVVVSSGHTDLDRAAAQAVQSWKFLPALKDGQAVPSNMPVRFVFTFN